MTTVVMTTAHNTKMGAAKCQPDEFIQSDFMERHKKDFVIIIRGSYSKGQAGYEYVLCNDGNVSHSISGQELKETTVNSAIIAGLFQATRSLSGPGNLFVVCATQVGFKGAATGSGLNCNAVSAFVNMCNSKKIKLCEVFIHDGSDTVKQLIRNVKNGNDVSCVAVKTKPTVRTDTNLHKGPVKNVIQNTQCDNTIQDMIIEGEKTTNLLNLGGMMGEMCDFESAVNLAHKFGTNTMMLFVENHWFRPPDTKLLNGKKMVLHGPLSVNMAAENDSVLASSRSRLKQIIERCNYFSDHIAALVLHPGNADSDERLIETLKEIVPLAKFPIALETMSGQGRELGVTFEHLIDIKNRVGNPENLKFCVDTCHIFGAGYDIRDPAKAITYISKTLGVENIAVFHVNGSMKECGSHRDVHAHMGEGCISIESLRGIVQAKEFQHIPKILETPKIKEKDAERYEYTKDIELLLQ